MPLEAGGTQVAHFCSAVRWSDQRGEPAWWAFEASWKQYRCRGKVTSTVANVVIPPHIYIALSLSIIIRIYKHIRHETSLLLQFSRKDTGYLSNLNWGPDFSMTYVLCFVLHCCRCTQHWVRSELTQALAKTWVWYGFIFAGRHWKNQALGFPLVFSSTNPVRSDPGAEELVGSIISGRVQHASAAAAWGPRCRRLLGTH